MRIEVPRSNIRTLFNFVTQRPYRIMSVYVARRNPLYLRYQPRNHYSNGCIVRVGDHCKVNDPSRNFIYGPNDVIYDLRNFDSDRRPGQKIVIEEKGTYRWVVVKQAGDVNKCNHWRSRGETLSYVPDEHDLYHIRGVYNDDVKMQPNGQLMVGRYGQWRPWVCICLRTTSIVRAFGNEYRIV